MASSVNFSLKSEDERNAIIMQFQNFLNSLDFSLQIQIQSRRLDIRPYLALLEDRKKKQVNDLMKIQVDEYIGFIKSFTENTNIMTKHFFVIVPYTPTVISTAGAGGLSGLFGGKKTKAAQKQSEEETFEQNRTQLEQRLAVVTQGLSSCGVRSTQLGTEEVIELFYKIFNPGEAQKAISLQ